MLRPIPGDWKFVALNGALMLTNSLLFWFKGFRLIGIASFAGGVASVVCACWIYSKELQIANRKKKIDEIQSLTFETGVACDRHEIDQILNGDLSIEHMRKILLYRKEIIWKGVNVDCKYFSNSTAMKCAIAPTISCSYCNDYEKTELINLNTEQHLQN